MIKDILKTLSNPLLYYSDKSGHCVFRNYNFFKNAGCCYNMTLPKKNVGKALEYRFELDKFLKRVYILTPVVLYLIFIHFNLTFGKVLLFELLWIIITGAARLLCSYNYSLYLMKHFGKYENVRFNPPIKSEKTDEYVNIYLSKAAALLVLIGILSIPSFIMKGVMKYDISPNHRKYANAVRLSKIYNAFYPKNETVYEIRTYAHYRQGNFGLAIKDLKAALDMSGKKLRKNDITRMGNLLFLKRLETSPLEAIDLFEKTLSKKKLTILQSSQLLWIKSNFKIEHNYMDDIAQNYDDLLMSLKSNDVKNWFYITCDKAYILYLMQDYSGALQCYNDVISYALENKKLYSKELPALLAERGFTQYKLSNSAGAQIDFTDSGINPLELANYEPKNLTQQYVHQKF